MISFQGLLLRRASLGLSWCLAALVAVGCAYDPSALDDTGDSLDELEPISEEEELFLEGAVAALDERDLEVDLEWAQEEYARGGTGARNPLVQRFLKRSERIRREAGLSRVSDFRVAVGRSPLGRRRWGRDPDYDFPRGGASTLGNPGAGGIGGAPEVVRDALTYLGYHPEARPGATRERRVVAGQVLIDEVLETDAQGRAVVVQRVYVGSIPYDPRGDNSYLQSGVLPSDLTVSVGGDSWTTDRPTQFVIPNSQEAAVDFLLDTSTLVGNAELRWIQPGRLTQTDGSFSGNAAAAQGIVFGVWSIYGLGQLAP